MTRVVRVDGDFGVERVGASVVAEYDAVPSDWYFNANGSRTMPFAVLTEVGLQPCGWLGCFTGVPLRAESEGYFRNLDGAGKLYAPVLPAAGTIPTHATLTNIARSAGHSTHALLAS